MVAEGAIGVFRHIDDQRPMTFRRTDTAPQSPVLPQGHEAGAGGLCSAARGPCRQGPVFRPPGHERWTPPPFRRSSRRVFSTTRGYRPGNRRWRRGGARRFHFFRFGVALGKDPGPIAHDPVLGAGGVAGIADIDRLNGETAFLAKVKSPRAGFARKRRRVRWRRRPMPRWRRGSCRRSLWRRRDFGNG